MIEYTIAVFVAMIATMIINEKIIGDHLYLNCIPGYKKTHLIVAAINYIILIGAYILTAFLMTK